MQRQQKDKEPKFLAAYKAAFSGAPVEIDTTNKVIRPQTHRTPEHGKRKLG